MGFVNINDNTVRYNTPEQPIKRMVVQPLPSDWFWAKGTTEADQAAWLGESVRYAREMGDIRLMIVWNVDFTTWTDDPKAGFAILRPDGSCPACAALHDALNQ